MVKSTETSEDDIFPYLVNIIHSVNIAAVTKDSSWYVIDMAFWNRITLMANSYTNFQCNNVPSLNTQTTCNMNNTCKDIDRIKRMTDPIDVTNLIFAKEDKFYMRPDLNTNEFYVLPHKQFISLVNKFGILPDSVKMDNYQCLKCNIVEVDKDKYDIDVVPVLITYIIGRKSETKRKDYFSRYLTLNNILELILDMPIHKELKCQLNNDKVNCKHVKVYRLTEKNNDIWVEQETNEPLVKIGLGTKSIIHFDIWNERSFQIKANEKSATKDAFDSMQLRKSSELLAQDSKTKHQQYVNDKCPQSSKISNMTHSIGTSIGSNAETNLQSNNTNCRYANDRFIPNSYLSTPSQTVPGLCGLKNLGNTCFLNSSIQCLSNIPMFREYFIEKYHDIRALALASSSQICCTSRKHSFKGALSLVFTNLIKDMWTPGNNVTDTRELKLKISKISNRFSGFTQHDSQEFMCVLLDALHEDLKKQPHINNACDGNRPEEISKAHEVKHNHTQNIIDGFALSKDQQQKMVEKMSDDSSCPDSQLSEMFWKLHLRSGNSIVIQTFQGQIKSTVQCLTCYHYSRTFDPFIFLCLPIAVDRSCQLMRKSTYLDRCSSPLADKPNILAAQLIIFGALITMDGLIHTVAVCLENNKSQSDDPNCSSQCDFTVKDMLMSAAKALIFVDTASYHPIPRMQLLQSKISFNSTHYYDLISASTPVTDVIEECTYSECSKDTHTVLERIQKNKFPRYNRVKLCDGVIFCQYPPSQPTSFSSPSSRVNSSNNSENQKDCFSIVTIRDKHGLLFPLMMSSTSLAPDLSSTELSSKDISNNNAKIKSSVATLAGCVLHSLNLENATISDLTINRLDFINQANSSENNEFPKYNQQQQQNDHHKNEKEQKNEDHQNHDYHQNIKGKIDDHHKNVQYFIAECKLSVSKKTSNRTNVSHTIRRILHKRICQAVLPYLGDRDNTMTLYQCLGYFTETELLAKEESWFCPMCKKKCQSTKKMDIYSLPDYLLIQLKRFKQYIYHREKLSTLVEYPIKDLDFQHFLPRSRRNRSYVYDLIAVSNHMGTLSDGHYTANALNSLNNKWYCFDDSTVRHISSPEKQIVTSSGYILCYKRRTGKLS